MRVATVLRSGGDFEPRHVARLVAQIERHLPGAEIVCLSDVAVECERIALKHDWPGWWAKMELYRPDIGGDLLYIDLDTTIVGPLDEIAAAGQLTVLADFYRPELVQSSLMFLPEADRAEIWRAFSSDPARHMAECATRERWGDQGFLNELWNAGAARWQDVLPGQVVSWKLHVRKAVNPARESGDGTVPQRARIVCFHGAPRPWEVAGEVAGEVGW